MLLLFKIAVVVVVVDICRLKTYHQTTHAGAYEGGRGGDSLGARARAPRPHPPPPSAQKRLKEERKFRPDMSARKNARSAQIQQN